MPKKTKKSGGKSDEERQVYLQQRAQAEEEMNKKKEETLGLFLKDKLQKEQRNTAVNLLKITDGWRTALRQARGAELWRDITVLQQTFERTLDYLDSVIEKLVRDLQEAERQEAQVRRCHLQHVEALWALQAKRLQCLQQQWDSSLQDVSAGFSSQRQQMLDQSQQQEAQLQELMLTVEQRDTDAMNEVKSLYEDMLAMYAGALEEWMSILEGREEVKNATQTSLEVLQHRSARTAQLDELIAKSQDEMNDKLKTLRKLEDTTRRLREKLMSNKAENCSMEGDLTAAINEVDRKCHKLRDQLTRARKAARKQLTELAIQGDAAAKKVQAVITKGDRVLRLADICCKLERKHDALLSSSSSSPRPMEESRQDRNTPAKEVGRFPELRELQRRVNGAVLQREALRKHKEELRRENEQLRLLLHQHDHHVHAAPLHVARAPTTSTPPPASDRRRITVIEAAHAVLKQ